MKQWYANELSKLTHVSVRTLHHYDKIGLLKPSLRLSNGYRIYSEKDLLTLQQIIALRFFGFKLSQIKTLLATNVNVLEHFSMQAQFLQEKAETLMEASAILKRLTSDCNEKKSIPWEKIIQLIEVFRMTQQLENTWASQVFNQEEIKQWATFEQGLKARFTLDEKTKFEQDWANIVDEIKRHLDHDPTSEVGIDIAKRCMALLNHLYGKEHLNLRKKIWEEGYKKNRMSEEHALPTNVVAWLDKAVDAYWRKRLYAILDQVGTQSPTKVLTRWSEILTEMYGDQQEPKDALVAIALADGKVSNEAKIWLKNTFPGGA